MKIICQLHVYNIQCRYTCIIIDNNLYIPGLFVDTCNIKHDIFTLTVVMSCQSDKSKQISSNLVVMAFW